MKLKKALLVCLLPAFVIGGCGKTTTDETENTTKQESAVEETVQDEQETGDTETESEASGEDADKETEASKDLFAMDTYMTVTAYGSHGEEAVEKAGYDSLDAAKEEGTAFVFMGHGTSHTAKISYSQMQSQMTALGYENVFIGTVEGEPEDTACEAVIEKIKEAGYKKVVLRPLMVVAGDHANNDMAGDDEDSWKSQFEASGAFDSVDCQIEGLGRIDAVEQIYVEHTKEAIDSIAK